MHSICVFNCDFLLHRRQRSGAWRWSGWEWHEFSRRRRGKPGGRWRRSLLTTSECGTATLCRRSADPPALRLWPVWDAAEEDPGRGGVVCRGAPHAWDEPPSPVAQHARTAAHALNPQVRPADGWRRAPDAPDARLWHLGAHHVSEQRLHHGPAPEECWKAPEVESHIQYLIFIDLCWQLAGLAAALVEVSQKSVVAAYCCLMSVLCFNRPTQDKPVPLVESLKESLQTKGMKLPCKPSFNWGIFFSLFFCCTSSSSFSFNIQFYHRLGFWPSILRLNLRLLINFSFNIWH